MLFRSARINNDVALGDKRGQQKQQPPRRVDTGKGQRTMHGPGDKNGLTNSFRWPSETPQSLETEHRRIQTTLPAPTARERLERAADTLPEVSCYQVPVIWDRANGYQVYDDAGNCWIDFKEDDIIKRIYNKSAKLLNTDYRYFESLQVIHYRKNEEYKNHYDAWDKTNKVKFNKYAKERGNRAYTLLFYLNDVRKGGETGFDMTKDKIKIKPVKGKALLFKSLNEDGSLNMKSRHGGLPVIQGEKWACNFWLRDKIQHKESPKKNISTVLNKLPELDLNYIEQNTSGSYRSNLIFYNYCKKFLNQKKILRRILFH